jgi:hypothetical protein
MDVRQKGGKCAFANRVDNEKILRSSHVLSDEVLCRAAGTTRPLFDFSSSICERFFFDVLDLMQNSPGTGEGESAGRGPSPRAQAGTLFLLPRLEVAAHV